MKLFFSYSLLLFVAIVFFSSCKRNYTCECQTSTNTVVPIELKGTNKVDATATCDKYNYGIYSTTGGCKLK